ncbi:MAG: filamentous hemagglutinin N-terminal domain-containing protein [Verrucomicrobiales bacterium]|nr:filamentous hemagglutinin N-terminal domain-containing protein [Verrucomicrobiales bacterium]
MRRGHSVPPPWRILAGILIVSLSLPPAAFANPQGGQNTKGQVRIESAPGRLLIHQESQRAVIDWESFSIDRGEVTRFLQPNADAAALNRVRGAAASQIDGMLRANGKIYLINPNGILVGPSGSIDVGGFVASTLETSDDDFLRDGDLRFAGNSDAAIINLGSISALDGDVVLMAGSVLNEGLIRAPRGTAALAAGNDILLTESGEERVFVRGSGGAKKAEGVTNTGEIEANIAELKAHGGNLYGMALKNEGRVAATGVTRSGGQIFLSAGGGKVRSTGTLKAKRSDGSGGTVRVDSGATGTTEIAGRIDASGENGAGGEITILGQTIEVIDGALILNDGETMGGTTRIGGGRRGEDPAFANAETVTVGGNVAISANANGSGDGGEVILFSNGSLVFNGHISAHAGARGGDGGFVELSGKRSVTLPSLTGRLDLSAPMGTPGTLLYDPIDIAILAGNSEGDLSGSPVSENTLYAGDIADFLNSVGSLVVTTDNFSGESWGNITMEGAANITWNSVNHLTLLADHDFIMDPGAVISSLGSGSFAVTAARSIVVGNGASISTTDGNLNLSANQQLSPMGGNVTEFSVEGGNLNFSPNQEMGPMGGNFTGVSVEGGTIQTLGGGILNVAGRGGDFGESNVGVRVTAGGRITGGTSATQFVTGNGGLSDESGNIGVEVTGVGSGISTNGGNLLVKGSGGGIGPISGSNSGVVIALGASITSGSGGGTTIEGTGGGGEGPNNKGIWVSSQSGPEAGSIVSGSDFLELVGIGGGSEGSTDNHGIEISGIDTLVSTTGARITLTATGGANTANALTVSGKIFSGGEEIQLITDGAEILSEAIINSGSGMTTIRPLSDNHAIDLGGGDDKSLALTDAELNRVFAGTLQIGSAQSGTITVSEAISQGQNLSLTTGADVMINNAIMMAPDKNFTTNAFGSITLATSNAHLSTSGTGEISLTTARNLSLADNTSITTTAGGITLSGNAAGTTRGLFEGVSIGNGASVNSGTGTISITGRGGDGNEAGNHGIRLDSTSTIGSLGGHIFLTGQAGGSVGAPSSQEGLSVRGNLTTTGIGNITLHGTGGNATSGNFGVHLFDEVLVSTVEGNISVTGLSGPGANSPGIQIDDFGGTPTVITSTSGAISLSGNGTTDTSAGIFILGSGTSIGGGTGNVELTATGDISLTANATIGAIGNGAVSLTSTRSISLGSGTRVTAVDGNLSLEANHQLVPDGGDFIGVLVDRAIIESTGTGLVTVRGKGGNEILPSVNVDYQIGVAVRNGGRIIGGTTGTVLVEGTGRQIPNLLSDYNYGVEVSDFGSMISSNGASISVTGLGGRGLNGNYGVIVQNDGQITSGGSGYVNEGGNNGGNNGFSMFNNGDPSSEGNVTVRGTGGSEGSASHGVRLQNRGAITHSGSGLLSVEGVAGAGGSFGISLEGARNGGASLRSTGSGNIAISTDSLEMASSTGVIEAGANTVWIRQGTNGHLINLGGADSQTRLGLSDEELDLITAGLLEIGDSNSGEVSVTAAITHRNHLTLSSGAGVAISNAITMAIDKNLAIHTLDGSDGTLSLDTAAAALSAIGSGNITLTSLRDIRLGAGSRVSTENGNVHFSANRGPIATAGSFTGILIGNALVSTSGTGTITLAGRGGNDSSGQHGIHLYNNASLSTVGRDLTLSGIAGDPLSSGIQIDEATLGAGGGTVRLSGTGSGAGTAIRSPYATASIGNALDTVILRSFSGEVASQGRVSASLLQLQDYSGIESVNFSLSNSSNDVDQLNTYSNGEGGHVGSVFFRDVDGFRVTEFLGASGISATGEVQLKGNQDSSEAVVIDRSVRSTGGLVSVEGRDIVVDASDVTASGSGSLTLTAGRAILVRGDSLLSVTDGQLALSANQNEDRTRGSFTGITVLNSRLESLGSGGISLRGSGGGALIGEEGPNAPAFSYPGFTNPSSSGLRLAGGTVISSSGTASNALGIELFGVGGLGNSDSVGITLEGTDTTVTSSFRPIRLDGFGGGQATGQRNRGIHFTGGLIQAGGNASALLYGEGGAGTNQNDGIQMDAGARVQAANGGITLDGSAGDTLGIGVMLGNNSGGLTITGSGSVEVMGTGSNADGIVLGNRNSSIGGTSAASVGLFARQSNLRLQRPLIASGNVILEADSGDVFTEESVTSRNGSVQMKGDNLTIDAPVTASSGDITLTFGDHLKNSKAESEFPQAGDPPFNGTAVVNAILSADGDISYIGGDGTDDLLTFAGYSSSKITLQLDDLLGVERVIGTGDVKDQVVGPRLPSIYEFTGPDAFNVGGVAFSSFENVAGGIGNNTFSFTGSATLTGSLDGGAGSNTLDYSTYATGVLIDLSAGSATGIVDGFENIASFIGSRSSDTLTGPGAASTYEFTGPDAMRVGSVSVSGFENLIAGPLGDTFVFLRGGSIRGTLDGGVSPTPVVNHLDYSLYGAPVFVNLGGASLAGATGIAGGFSNLTKFTGSALLTDQFFGSNLATSYQITGPNGVSSSLFTATGFENLTGGPSSDTFVPGPGVSFIGRVSGGSGAGTDTLDYSLFGRAVTVNIGPNTATGFAGGFTDLERIIGSPGNDRFNFLNQATIQFVDGGGGNDLLEINDSNLGGDNTYDFSANSVSRNPLYTFNNFETLRLFLGPGTNTVNSGFFPYTQFIQGGSGLDTLNLPGVTSLNEGNPIRNVYHFGIDGPRPEGSDTGGLLQLEINQQNSDKPNTEQGFNTENRFSIVDPGTLSQQIGALSGAFAAAITAQASLIVVDGNPYLVFRPFSLDGSGISPSNLAIDALNESLGVDANLELAASIGYTGPVLLFNPDGAHGIDLSGDPIDPVLLTILQESLAIAAAAELSAALGLNLVVSVTATDGIIPTSLDNAVPGQPVVLLLTEQLGDPAFNELNGALGAD